MTVNQIYSILNSITSEILGSSEIVNEDLSNVVDVGTEIFNSSDVDNYVKSLVNHIGKVIFVNRKYNGSVPSILMDSWEYGSVCEKIRAELPTATENETWELTNGQSYAQDVFYKPTISAKFFNNKVTFEIPMSFTELQVKESFSNAGQLNSFISMIYNSVENAMTVKMDSLIMRTINNFIGTTFNAEFSDAIYTGVTSTKAVNLLYEYNTKYGTTLTADEALTTPEFIRFSSYRMGLYTDRMNKISTLFNIGATERFTPNDRLHVVLLSDFKNACGAYLESDTFHNEYIALPKAESVPYWQGSGTDYSFDSVSSINVTISNGDSTATVNATGILGIMFDSDACGVCNTDRRVTTAYNAKAEFFNNFYKFDASYFNDTNENFVVFYAA